MQNKDSSQHVLGKLLPAILVATFCCLLWGSAFPCVKIGYRLFGVRSSRVPDIWVYAGSRFALAGLLVILFTSISRKTPVYPKGKDSWLRVLTLCSFQTVGQYARYYIGLAHTAGVKASILNGSGVIILLVISAFIFRLEKLTFRKFIASIIGLAGIILINFDPDALISSFSFIGDGMLLLSIVSSNMAICFIKLFGQKDDPVMLSGWQFFIGGILLIILGKCFGGSIHPSGASAWLMLLYLALVSALAYTLWSILLKYNPVSRIAMCKFMNPVFGVILSGLLLSEPISPLCIISLICVAGSIFIVNRG